ncbi:hypothetical protein AB0N73_05755 [Microbacterium sp. NPDC089189]|uniref:hypothetical protein n=1 Tax=Microbacterium sp. NPDC089189 TaxID=3154972 RepID=UPI0034306D92
MNGSNTMDGPRPSADGDVPRGDADAFDLRDDADYFEDESRIEFERRFGRSGSAPGNAPHIEAGATHPISKPIPIPSFRPWRGGRPTP